MERNGLDSYLFKLKILAMLFLVAQHSSEFPRRSGSQTHFQQDHQALMSPPLLRRSAVPLGCGRASALGAAPAENSPGGLGLVQLSRAHLGALYAGEAQCLLSLQHSPLKQPRALEMSSLNI
uniref:Uncharacterized protein n=1 Tax=Myotis myotis TaxID=51298 RepID=A0A7J7VZ13_MYOMY|nr:hypothetical protein mMyoMyo1_012362 [Myotis myotis]